LVSFAIDTANWAIDNWAARTGSYVIGLGHESGHVDKSSDSVIGNWDAFELAIDEICGRGSDQDAEEERTLCLHCYVYYFQNLARKRGISQIF